MALNFGSDYSSLFSSLGSGAASVAGSSFISDYMSIKNGSYGKLMKAYYSNSSSSATSSAKKASSAKSVAEQIIDEKKARSLKKETEESKAYTAVKKTTSDLKTSMDKLANSTTLFEQKLITTTDEDGVETTQFGYDKDAIYNAVSDYVKNYNAVQSAAAATGNTSIYNRALSMQNDTKAVEKELNQMGITIKADGTLSINKDNFMKADMQKVASFFQENTAYATNLETSGSLMNQTASYEQLRGTMYTYDGTFSGTGTSGQSYSSVT